MMTIHIPAPSSMVWANLLGLCGLVAMVAAVGGLAGPWWAVLTGGVILVGLSVIATTHVVAEQQPAPGTRVATAAVPLGGPVGVAEESRAA